MAEGTVGTEGERLSPVEVVNGAGTGAFVLACEHASNRIPPEYDGLGLEPHLLESHIAWDPGALGVALKLSELLDAPLIASRVSRLVYDCNRPPMSDGATPALSEVHRIPGNENLGDSERRRRADSVYEPFRAALAAALDARHDRKCVLATVHSFTPVYKGMPRDVQIGILNDDDDLFAKSLLAAMAADRNDYIVAANEPYSAADGVTHTLAVHATPRGICNVMIEIRNDLISTPESLDAMGRLLAARLNTALGIAAAASAGVDGAA